MLVVGYQSDPKENYMDFMLQLKFLYDNHKYFENNGLLNSNAVN